MKIIFMGTPEFAVPCLKALIGKHDILSVVTREDKPKGRGMQVRPSPVKAAALEAGLKVLQLHDLKSPESAAALKALAPELGVIVAFGQFLNREILDIPKFGWLNVHASLLPRYRGAAPIPRAIQHGDRETGLTLQFIELKMDCGDIVLQKKTEISAEDTARTLENKLSRMAPDALLEALEQVRGGKVVRVKQDEHFASLAPRLTKDDGQVHWEQDAGTIYNLVRAMDPWPGAWTRINGSILKIWEARVVQETERNIKKSGELLALDKDGWTIQTGNGQVLVTQIQAPDGKRMSAYDYGLGHGIQPGTQFETGGK